MTNRTHKSWAIFAIFNFLCTGACAPKQSETRAHQGTATVLQYDSPTEAKRVAKNWRVACETSADCPDSVAQLITRSGSTNTLCTSTLIAPDLMLTNSHCFEDTKLTPAELCQNTRFVFADKSVSGTESAECKEVVSQSQIDEKNFDRPDYMVLRLTRSLKRAAAVVSRKGVQHHERLTMYKIDPIENRGSGRLKNETCKALMATAFFPASLHSTDPVIVTRDCGIDDGNSGSPLMKGDGKLVAIAFASIPYDSVSTALSLAKGNVALAQAAQAKMGRITNLSCLDIPLPVAPADAACKNMVAPKSGKSPNLDARENRAAISSAVRAAYPAHADMIERKLGYHMALSQDGASVFYEAFCFNAASTWLSQFKIGATYAVSAELKPPLMKWNLSWTIDADLKAVPQLTEASAPVLRPIAFSPSTLATSGTSPVKDLGSEKIATWAACPTTK